MSLNRISLNALLLTVYVLLVGCHTEQVKESRLVSLSLSSDTLYVELGSSLSVDVIATYSCGRQEVLDATLLTYSIVDTLIASCQVKAGRLVVTGLSSGETSLSITSLGVELSIAVIVSRPNSSVDITQIQGMPILRFGISEAEIKRLEESRGNEVFMSGEVPDEPNMRYVTVIGKIVSTHRFYDYYFTDDQMDEVQTYTTLYDRYWTLEDGGRPTVEWIDMIATWGFKMYGYDNTIGYPTAVSWSAERSWMLTFGPRIRSGQTYFMFNFYEAEEPIVEPINDPSITLDISAPVGSPIALGIHSEAPFQIDWGDGVLVDYASGVYLYDQMIRGSLQGSTLQIFGDRVVEFISMGNRVTYAYIASGNALQELRITNGLLETIDLSQCSHLKILNCSNNQLQVLDLSTLTELQEVHCFNNKLRHITLPTTSCLELLYAYQNLLTQIDLEDHPNLSYLNLRSNHLTQVDLRGQLNLVELQLGDNSIDHCLLPSTLEHLLCATIQGNKLSTESLNDLIILLPDVTGIPVSDDEISWKKLLSIAGNPGSDKCNRSIAQERGWRVL